MGARGGARSSGANGGWIGLRILGPSEQICSGRVRLPHRCAPLHSYHYSLFFFFFDSHQKRRIKINLKIKIKITHLPELVSRANNQFRVWLVVCFAIKDWRKTKKWKWKSKGGNFSFSSSPSLSKKHRLLSRSHSRFRQLWGRCEMTTMTFAWSGTFYALIYTLSLAFVASADVWIQREFCRPRSSSYSSSV